MTTLKEASDPEPLTLIARTGAAVQLDWPAKERVAVLSTPPARKESALFMSESIEGLNVGAHFLDRLSAVTLARSGEFARPSRDKRIRWTSRTSRS